MRSNEKEVLILQDIINYNFKDTDLLIEALSHSSYCNERKINQINCNERMEFLGDAVLELVSSMFLYSEHPEYREGELSKLRASLVCEKSLAPCAERIGLGKYVLLGRGEDLSGGRQKPSILSDALEAIIGAVFLDGGFEEASDFIYSFILNGEALANIGFKDYKTCLQELVQAQHHTALVYEVLNMEGPEHDRTYTVRVLLEEKELGRGTGKSKKQAEMAAAKEAINNYNEGL